MKAFFLVSVVLPLAHCGCGGPSSGTATRPPETPASVPGLASRGEDTLDREREAKEVEKETRVLAATDQTLRRSEPALALYGVLAAETPAELDAAYSMAQTSSRTMAFKALLYGALDRRSTPVTFGRRLELICDTLDPSHAPAGDGGDRETVAAMYAHLAGSLRGRVLAKTRSHELAAPTTVRYALLDPARPDRPLLALALCDAPATAGPCWRAGGGAWDGQSLEGLLSDLAQDLKVEEVKAFLRRLVDERPEVLPAAESARRRLTQELCDTYARGNGWDAPTVAFVAGLDGTERGLVDDLVALTHPAAVEKTRMQLQTPAAPGSDARAERRRAGLVPASPSP